MPTLTQIEIKQLESLRKQAFWWRTGATLVTVLVVAGCLYTLNTSVRGLAEAGPAQDEFTGYMSEAMQKDIAPNIQTLASQTITEIQPQIRDEFNHLNTRVPELTQATQKELMTLQTELPKSGEKTLNDTFDKVLASRETKIRQMYPDVTEDQVKAFVANLQKTGETEMRDANDELFAPHQSALASILDHMHKIQSSEAAETKGQDPSWEMGLAVLDVVRADLQDAKDGKPQGLAETSTTPNKGDAKGGKK